MSQVRPRWLSEGVSSRAEGSAWISGIFWRWSRSDFLMDQVWSVDRVGGQHWFQWAWTIRKTELPSQDEEGWVEQVWRTDGLPQAFFFYVSISILSFWNVFHRFWLSAEIFEFAFYLLEYSWESHKRFLARGWENPSQSSMWRETVLFCLPRLLGKGENERAAEDGTILCDSFFEPAPQTNHLELADFSLLFTVFHLDWVLWLWRADRFRHF